MRPSSRMPKQEVSRRTPSRFSEHFRFDSQAEHSPVDIPHVAEVDEQASQATQKISYYESAAESAFEYEGLYSPVVRINQPSKANKRDNPEEGKFWHLLGHFDSQHPSDSEQFEEKETVNHRTSIELKSQRPDPQQDNNPLDNTLLSHPLPPPRPKPTPKPIKLRIRTNQPVEKPQVREKYTYFPLRFVPLQAQDYVHGRYPSRISRIPPLRFWLGQRMQKGGYWVRDM